MPCCGAGATPLVDTQNYLTVNFNQHLVLNLSILTCFNDLKFIYLNFPNHDNLFKNY